MPIAQWHKMLCMHNCKSFLVNLYCHLPVEETLFSNRNLIFKRNYFEKTLFEKITLWTLGNGRNFEAFPNAPYISAVTKHLILVANLHEAIFCR